MKLTKKLLVFTVAVCLCLPGTSAAALSSNGTIGIVEFPHHDLGFHGGSYTLEAENAFAEINGALELFGERDDFASTFEQSRFIYDYLLNYPQKYDELKQAVVSGQLSLSAGYTDPFTSFLSPEMLVREFILGKKWNEDVFGGDSRVFLNSDIPGSGAQMPQILKKAGVDYLYLTRSNLFPSFTWDEFKQYQAMDGTKVDTYFTNLYTQNLNRNNWTLPYTQQILDLYEKQRTKNNLGDAFPIVLASDMLMPSIFPDGFIDLWNSDSSRSTMKYSTMQEILDMVFSDATIQKEDVMKGEWPTRWVYEASSIDYNSYKMQRDAERFLRDAETLYVIRAFVEGGFLNYPADEIDKAWRAVDHSCHCYSPEGTIEEYKKIWGVALQLSQDLYESGLEWLISQIDTQTTLGKPFAVYNDLAWTRDDIVIMDKPVGIGNIFRIVDESGAEVIYQMSADGRIVFLAEDVPSLGYKTYYIRDGAVPSAQAPSFNIGALWTAAYENDYYRVTPANTAGTDKNGRKKVGGLEQIRDLEIGKDLFDTTDFNIAEWKDFYYPDGMGANPALNMRQPEYDTYESVSSITQAWTCVESGPVRTVFDSKANTGRGPIIMRITVYDCIKKIDLDVVLENNDDASYHQQRLMFPINTGDMFGADGMVDHESAKVSYEAPFGVVNVGDEALQKFSRWNDNASVPAGYNAYWNGNNNAGSNIVVNGQTYTAPEFSRLGLPNTHYDDLVNTAPRPRFLQNWISAGDEDFSVTISSYNLAWDYQDATANPVKNPVLQPMLVSNVRSNNGNFVWSQPGRIEYYFSITSDNADYTSGSDKMAIQANNPLTARLQTSKAPGASMPQQFESLAVDKDNVIVTSVKKAEDDNENVIIRFYEARGMDDGDVTITFPAVVKAAKEVNLIERETGKTLTHAGVTVTMGTSHWSIETAKVALDGITDAPLAPFSMFARQSNAGAYLLWMNKENPDNIVVEMKPSDGNWQQIALLPGDAYTYTASVPEGRYKFRVKAVMNGVSSAYAASEEIDVDFSPIMIDICIENGRSKRTGTINNISYYNHWKSNASDFFGGVSGGTRPGEWWNVEDPLVAYSTTASDDTDYYSIVFTGSQIELFTRMDNTQGYAAVSIDGGPDEEICLYAPSVTENSPIQSFYTSPVFTDGLDHTVKVRCLKKASEDGGDRISFAHAIVTFETPSYIPVFTDKNGDVLNSLSSDFINVAMPYTNIGADPISLTMIVAVYDQSGRLVHNATVPLTVEPSKTESFRLSLDMPQNADGSYALKRYHASVFLWDSVTFAPIKLRYDF